MPVLPSYPRAPDYGRVLRRASVAFACLALLGTAVTGCTAASSHSAGAAPQATGPQTSAPTQTSAPASVVPANATSQPAVTVVSAITPATGSTGVPTDAPVLVSFSGALPSGASMPKITPAVAGTWSTPSASTLRFTPAQPWPLSTSITVSVDEPSMTKAVTSSFTTAGMSILRVQQLLAQLGYLPLSFTPAAAASAPNAEAMDQTGTFHWKWTSAQAILGPKWSPGVANTVTTGALMDFERQHGISTLGVAGPQTSAALLADALAHHNDPDTYDYVVASKALPERLTVYVNGAVKLGGIAVNTGVPGADTADGTFPVYSHTYSSQMRGTDVDGSTYDVVVYWASYFNGGDALHAYPRSYYGAPASNGCVEMDTANAQAVYPYTPIGTLVTVT
jgi:lipoprotein-anchoring transpeptidase ErfK/SrfK